MQKMTLSNDLSVPPFFECGDELLVEL